jgi:hypothetical protein
MRNLERVLIVEDFTDDRDGYRKDLLTEAECHELAF